MAIYHLHQSTINRSKGFSAFQAYAYQSRDEIIDEYTGEVCNYAYKGDSLYNVFDLPANADKSAFSTPLDLVREMEKCESSTNACTGIYGDVALPKELTFEQQKELMNDFAKTFTEQGQAVIMNMHPPHDNNENYHFHYIATVRPFEENGQTLSRKNKCFNEYDVTDGKERKFLSAKEMKKEENQNFKKIFKYKVNGKIEELTQEQAKAKGLHPTKDRTSRAPLQRTVYYDDFLSVENLLERRKAWEVCANECMAKYSIEEKISCETLKAQGIDREPQKHLGAKFYYLQKKGIELVNATHNRIVKEIEKTKRLAENLLHSITHRQYQNKDNVSKEQAMIQSQINELITEKNNLVKTNQKLNRAKTSNKEKWNELLKKDKELSNRWDKVINAKAWEKLFISDTAEDINKQRDKLFDVISKRSDMDMEYEFKINTNKARISDIEADISVLRDKLHKSINEPTNALKQAKNKGIDYVKEKVGEQNMEFAEKQREIYNIAIDLAQAKLESIKPADQRVRTDNELRNAISMLSSQFDREIENLPKLEQQQVLNQISKVYDKLASGTPEEFRNIKDLERQVIKPHIENERSLGIDR